jgi:DHA2 family metal-tetracycline-proton antiporter-like MFS transporter
MHAQQEITSTGRRGVLLIVCSALFFGVLNGSGVAVVLPEIGADLGIDDADLSWVLSGFLLTYGVAIPFYGRLANRFGTRRLFLIGVGVFAVGSLLCAVATGLGTLLAARTVQAAGGAAVPGLGMTLASRAYPAARRGMVLGMVSATMGLGAAVGPLAAGVVAEIADWRALFWLSALAGINVPLGLRYLERDEDRDERPLGLLGGALFGLGVAATLYFVTRGSQAGWGDHLAVSAAVVAAISLAGFAAHQRRSAVPFIPAELLRNRKYLLLTLLGFAVTFANLATQIGLPFLFDALHGMSTLEIGVALVPAAIASAVVGVAAGRLVDRAGPTVPVRVGAVVMLIATFSLSTWVGTSQWTVAVLAAVFGVGFALVNTPLAAVISLLVPPKDLATALSLNTMMFFIGGSFGATLFTSIAASTGDNSTAWNPVHDAGGIGFSNAFLALIVPIVIALALSAVLTHRPGPSDSAINPNELITTGAATMNVRTIDFVTTVDPQPGSGILHPFPTAEIPHLDPFVFLDTGAPMNLGVGDIYVGPHAHRGVQPVSLLFSGRIEHRDSLGTHRTVTSGGMQWLVSGSGALHEEVLNGDDDGIFHMAQLWVNVPAALKMAPPEHHAEPADQIPEITSLGEGATVRLYAGTLGESTGPAPLPTDVFVGHVLLDARSSLTIPVPEGWTTAFTVVAGSAETSEVTHAAGTTVVYRHDGDGITVSSEQGGELLLMCGEPIGEPIAMGGGFVMNTTDEIAQAFADQRAGRMGDLVPSR